MYGNGMTGRSQDVCRVVSRFIPPGRLISSGQSALRLSDGIGKTGAMFPHSHHPTHLLFS